MSSESMRLLRVVLPDWKSPWGFVATGPDLGPIKSVLVAPESGSWRLDELTVASSATQHTDRFLCGRLLGAKEGAGYLTPVPPNAVVYGSGEAASIISRVS